MRPWSLAIVAVAALCSCLTAQPAPTPSPECVETSTTGKVVNGYTLYGKGGDVFLVFARTPKDSVPPLRKATFQKMLVVVEHPIIPTTDAERIPNSLNILGRNLLTGTAKTFEVGRHNSELGIGVEWGGNFEFPDAGCWEMRLSAPRNADTTIVVKVL
ncbi:MAG TPA: hypothetical protein VGK15_02525 [Candidatus Limnocylindria bacterium]